MIDLSGLPEDYRFEYAVDFTIRHALDDLCYCVSDLQLDDKVKVANALLTIFHDLDSY